MQTYMVLGMRQYILNFAEQRGKTLLEKAKLH